MLCGLRRRLRPQIQPGEILPQLRRQSSQASENRKRTEKEVLCGQLGAEKSLICKAFRRQNRGRWYKVSPSPENAFLTVHKAHYDKLDLYSPARKGVQLHPAPQLLLFQTFLRNPDKFYASCLMGCRITVLRFSGFVLLGSPR